MSRKYMLDRVRIAAALLAVLVSAISCSQRPNNIPGYPAPAVLSNLN